MAPTFYDNETQKRYTFDEDDELPIVFNKNLDLIRKKLHDWDESLVLPPKLKVLGRGEYGIVIKSTIDDVVLKIMDIRDRNDRHCFRHEIRMLRHLNQHTKTSRSPLGPKFYKASLINKENWNHRSSRFTFGFSKSIER